MKKNKKERKKKKEIEATDAFRRSPIKQNVILPRRKRVKVADIHCGNERNEKSLARKKLNNDINRKESIKEKKTMGDQVEQSTVISGYVNARGTQFPSLLRCHRQ
jgi:hypothetical protein